MKNVKRLTGVDLLILFFTLLIALSFRLYKINTPLADLHSWRQADTAAVARNFVRNGIDLLHPRYDDVSSISTGLANPQGYRFVEFPLYNAIIAATYKIFPHLPIEVIGRAISIFFSLIIICVIYYLAFYEWGRLAAITASLVYSVFPYFVFFSRVVLPETMATAFSMLAIFFIYLSLRQSRKLLTFVFYFLSLVSLSTAFLVKPPAVVYGLAIVFIFWEKYRFSFLKKISFYLYFLICLIPFILWRRYISQFPQGIPPFEWLFTSVNTSEGLKNIFLKPAFFRWIFFERLNNAILGGYLGVFFVMGVILKTKKYLMYSILICALLYLFIIEGGNVQHEYYQTIILPAVALFVGRGIAYVLENNRLFIHQVISWGICLSFIVLSFFFSYYIVKDYYNYPPELPQIARIINALTTPNDLIVTDRLGDTTLLYLMDRKGAPALYAAPDELKKQGFSYLVTFNKNTAAALKSNKLAVVFENDQFTLFRL